jgi:hypothetical protein
MDDKLPASTDFSQGPQPYGDISGTFVNNDGTKTSLGTTRHLSPVPMRPIGTFGTFTMRNKNGEDIPTASIQNILRRTGGNVGGELKTNKGELQRQKKLIELGKVAEEAGIEVGSNEHGKTLIIPQEIFENPEIVQKIMGRLTAYGEFIHLKKHWENSLLPKMNVIDASERANYVNPINGALDALAWLEKAPETGDETVQQLESKLEALKKLLDTFEEVVQKNTTPEKKKGDGIATSPEDIKNLFTTFS